MRDNDQIQVQEDLFEEYNKITDKFITLLSLIFATAGFTFTVINITLGKNVTIQDVVNNNHIKLSFVFTLIAFLISLYNVLATSYHKKIILRDNSIGYRDGDELKNNNIKLFGSISKQKDHYIITIAAIGFSLISLYSYFAQYRATSIILILIVFTALVISIRKSHK